MELRDLNDPKAVWALRTMVLAVDGHTLNLTCLDCDQDYYEDATGGNSINLHDFLELSVSHYAKCPGQKAS